MQQAVSKSFAVPDGFTIIMIARKTLDFVDFEGGD